VYSVY